MPENKPDYTKLDSKLKRPNKKYNNYPTFDGSSTEYQQQASKMYDAGFSKEDVVNKLGVIRNPLKKEDYPHVLPEDFTTDENISVARGSGKNKDGTTRIKNESIYEGANTANRRVKNEMNQSITTDKDGNFQYHRFDTNKRNAGIKPGDGFDLHHKRTLNQYAPFYEGLTDSQAIELTNWFDQEGYTVGNNKKNLLKMTEAQHMGEGSIHEWMDDRRLNPKTNMAEYKQLADYFKGKPLNDRFADIVRYLDDTQEFIEKRLGTKGGYTDLNKLKKKVGTIPSGPRKGQPLPVNRRTLGDAIIKDLRMQGGAAKFSAVTPWFDYLPILDQATGGHVERTIDKGVNVVRQAVGQKPNELDAPDPEGPITQFANGVARQIFNVGASLFKTNAKYPL